MEGLARYTPPHCCICPKRSKILPADTISNDQQSIAGEIDFYLNSNLSWGYALLINGVGIGEHLSRFSPPQWKICIAWCERLRCDRNTTGRPANISKHPNRISMFFKRDDSSVAQCRFGEDSAVVKITPAI
jgi:hypothetical protein